LAKDHLGGELSIRAQVDASGITASAKSRALNALDRLVGNLVDWPGAFVEGAVRRKRAKDDAEINLIEALAAEAKEHVLSDPALVRRALWSLFGERVREQKNIESVASEAIESLKQLPPPEGESSEGTVSDDWLNLFSSYAKMASSEHFRALWGRVLAGEIREPGAFSLSTLRVMAELDKQIAASFEQAMRLRFSGFIPKSPELSGELLLDLTMLEEVGLLQEVNGSLQLDLKNDSTGYAHYFEKDWGVRMKLQAGAAITVLVIRISRSGREIGSILPNIAPEEQCSNLFSYISSKPANVELLKMAPTEKNKYSYHVVGPLNVG
jgi:hypothetical protein